MHFLVQTITLLLLFPFQVFGSDTEIVELLQKKDSNLSQKIKWCAWKPEFVPGQFLSIGDQGGGGAKFPIAQYEGNGKFLYFNLSLWNKELVRNEITLLFKNSVNDNTLNEITKKFQALGHTRSRVMDTLVTLKFPKKTKVSSVFCLAETLKQLPGVLFSDPSMKTRIYSTWRPPGVYTYKCVSQPHLYRTMLSHYVRYKGASDEEFYQHYRYFEGTSQKVIDQCKELVKEWNTK